jgi:hypothetical protein
MQHGQHLHLPPSNDDRGYDDEDVSVTPALDLGEAADHFVAVAVSSWVFLSLLSSLSRAAVAVAAAG